MAAFGAALVAAASLSVSTWGARWTVFFLSAIVALIALAVVILIARYLGARYSGPLRAVMARVSWALSYPFRPALLIHDILLRGAAPEKDASLDFALSVDTDSNPLDEHEVRMIRGIVQLDQTVAREIMVPRVDIAAVEAGTSLEALADAMNEAGHSRVPVYDGDLDHIQGVAHAKDVLRQIASGRDPSAVTAREVARPSALRSRVQEPGGTAGRVSRRSASTWQSSVDEYGGVSGIVTIEDLLEEIVGEIQDEFRRGGACHTKTWASPSSWWDARLPIDELKRVAGHEHRGGRFSTPLAGLVFEPAWQGAGFRETRFTTTV